jgi:ATP-dependent RNA helicase RhlE
VQVLILDEADRMLDMGFIRDIRKIVDRVPKQRHSMLFSATMPGDVVHLVKEILTEPVRIDISPTNIAAEKIDQRVYFVEAKDKRALLTDLLRDSSLSRVIVFTRTKHGANKVAETLERSGHAVEAIHGNKSQNARQRALESFRNGESRVLVATDIAARGIDVDGISHVINFELPDVAESYVHRIGRTARAGAGGVAIAFCDPAERGSLKAIERLVKQELTVIGGVRPTGDVKSDAKPARHENRPHNQHNRARNRRRGGQSRRAA